MVRFTLTAVECENIGFTRTLSTERFADATVATGRVTLAL